MTTTTQTRKGKAMSKTQEVKMVFTIPDGWDMHEFVQVLAGALVDAEGNELADMVAYRYEATA